MTIPTISYGGETELLRSYIPLLNMTSYPVDSSPLGFISPPIEQVVQYEKSTIPYPLCSPRYSGLQGVAWPTSLYPLLSALRRFCKWFAYLPHDFLFLKVVQLFSPGRLWDSCSQLGVFSYPRFSAFSPALVSGLSSQILGKLLTIVTDGDALCFSFCTRRQGFDSVTYLTSMVYKLSFVVDWKCELYPEQVTQQKPYVLPQLRV